MGNLALPSKKVKMNSCVGKAQADDFQNRTIASKFCKLIDDGKEYNLCLQFKTKSCDGMAALHSYQ